MAKQRPKPTRGHYTSIWEENERQKNALRALAAMKWEVFRDRVWRMVPPAITMDPNSKVRFLPMPSLV